MIKLGGINVPSKHALLAHSDGDVVLHALCDALLGALAMGDIGEHYPDTAEQWRGVDSANLLADVYKKVKARGYQLNNVDITIAAQVPKLQPWKAQMAERIAHVLETHVFNVNVKATTTEKLGFVGRCEGIAVDAVVLVVQQGVVK